MNVAYLHGFASSPLSRKGVHLARAFEARDIELRRPDLNNPSFARLTYTASLESIDAMDAAASSDAPWCLVGSSMGGYLAARWAELNPTRVRRLLLLCPGFDLPSRWPHMLGEAVMGHWQQSGFCTFPDGAGQPTAVHWGFVEDARTHPAAPIVPCTTHIIHGVRDETVPIESSRAYAAAHPERVTLTEVDDDHALGDSIERITRAALTLFDVSG